jgi:hypothetical protein
MKQAKKNNKNTGYKVRRLTEQVAQPVRILAEISGRCPVQTSAQHRLWSLSNWKGSSGKHEESRGRPVQPAALGRAV